MRNRAPFLGGNFGLWGGIFSSVDCLLIHYRQKDDPWNAVCAGFITGGVLACRGGASQAFKQACMGGVILAIIEVASNLMGAIMMRRQMEFAQEQQRIELARMKQMLHRGGDNPWEVNYSKDGANAIDGTDSDHNLKDSSKKSGDGAGEKANSLLDRAKRVTF